MYIRVSSLFYRIDIFLAALCFQCLPEVWGHVVLIFRRRICFYANEGVNTSSVMGLHNNGPVQFAKKNTLLPTCSIIRFLQSDLKELSRFIIGIRQPASLCGHQDTGKRGLIVLRMRRCFGLSNRPLRLGLRRRRR